MELAGDQVADDVWHRLVQIITNHKPLQHFAADKLFKVSALKGGLKSCFSSNPLTLRGINLVIDHHIINHHTSLHLHHHYHPTSSSHIIIIGPRAEALLLVSHRTGGLRARGIRVFDCRGAAPQRRGPAQPADAALAHRVGAHPSPNALGARENGELVRGVPPSRSDHLREARGVGAAGLATARRGVQPAPSARRRGHGGHFARNAGNT